jgi:YVTN family beta-propeller protein
LLLKQASFLLALFLMLDTPPASAFVTFESGPVRPLAKSPDGSRLFVCNIPDNRVEIFDITPAGLVHVTSVPVGLEPVAVAARTNTEIWVVNHLSDSVSVVDVSSVDSPRVTRSLTVGDEPRDIVFGGPAFDHAFITTAHRGQNSPFDPQLTTPGIGRADVWVFDANDLGTSFGGDEKTIVTLFGDTPRPLAVSPDGGRVYAGVHFSGNQTTVLSEEMVPDGGEAAGGLPDPQTNASGVPRPETGLIVAFDGSQWVDELGRDWSSLVRFSLPDYDVFAIDATQDPPVQVAGSAGRFAHVGTTLFNIAVNPADGKLFVSNLEAFNEVRFEGVPSFADTTLRGHPVESRITIIDPVAETVTPVHLNKHITFDQTFEAIPNATNERSLAFPLDMAFTADGSTVYVAAFGSSRIGTFATAELAGDTFTPDAGAQIELTGGGPAGIVLDETTSRLFVLTRFDNSVSIVNTALGVETAHIALHNPEPASVVEGRPFLYDARHTSSRGDQACASCHIFGDFDGLAWELGDPSDEVLNNPSLLQVLPGSPDKDFHPMKGPMATQSLRGMANHGPMHWRGDKTGGNDEETGFPDGGSQNEHLGFTKFNSAFVTLLGRTSPIDDADMDRFADFILQVMYPPNPIRALDNALASVAQSPIACDNCHQLQLRSREEQFSGFFGSAGTASDQGRTQIFKIPHFRNLYQKVGMFGHAEDPFLNPGDNGFKGDQIRGFGFAHDGSIDTLFRFSMATVFNPTATAPGFTTDQQRIESEKTLLAFDSNHRPIVGQQVTLSPTTGLDADARIAMMLNRADVGECDVVARGVLDGEDRGWFYASRGFFKSDRFSDGFIPQSALFAHALGPGQELTLTAVPLNEGERIGIDRDADGFPDRQETDASSDETDAESLPCAFPEPVVFRKAALNDIRGRLQLQADVTLAAPYSGGIIAVKAEDSGGTIVVASVDGGFESNSSGTAFKYKAPKGTTGITKAFVKASKIPGQYRISLRTSGAWVAPEADEDAASTEIRLHVLEDCFEGAALKVK